MYSLKSKIIPITKSFLLIAVMIFITTFIEIYWAMGSFYKRISSGNPDSSFFDDAYLISLFTTLILSFVFLLFTLIKNIYLKIAIEVICLISACFFWNYSIFVDRESSWSTYTFNEEINYTISVSILPILILSILSVFLLHYISKKI